MKRVLILTVVLALTVASQVFAGDGGASNPALLNPTLATKTAPATFKVRFETTKGSFVVAVHRDWAPAGADRFFNLVTMGYYDDAAFFRVIRDPRPFMAQVGFSGDPKVNAAWSSATIPDDPVVKSNLRGLVSFAKTNAPNSRTTQFFINYAANDYLDGYGFAPFGEVVEGMDVVDSLFAGYGEGAPTGSGPSQGRIASEGNSYLKKNFPKLDYILHAAVVGNDDGKAMGDEPSK